MSNGEQAAALRLLMAAREVLTDPLASDAERKRIAEHIGLFINHEPVAPELNPTCGRCGQPFLQHSDGFAVKHLHCPKGGGVFTHADSRVGERRGRVEEADDE